MISYKPSVLRVCARRYSIRPLKARARFMQIYQSLNEDSEV